MNEHPYGVFIELYAATLETNRYFDGIYSNKEIQHLNKGELIESIKRR